MKSFILYILLIGSPSLVLSDSWLGGLSTGISNIMYGDFLDSRGVELQYKNVKRSNYEITYQYQLWRIRDKSVCANYQGNLLDYSKCTVEAKKLFNDFCAYLQNNPKEIKNKRQLKNMYCTFASTYQPIQASISASNEQETELSKAKDICNSLALQAMSTKSASDVTKRDIACTKYKNLKGNQ